MSKKIWNKILGTFTLSLIIIAAIAWYQMRMPSVEVLKKTSQQFGGILAYGTGKPISNEETKKYIESVDKYEWYSGVCSPFQKNIQSILLTTRKNISNRVFVTVYSIENSNGKVNKQISLQSDNDYDSLVKEIKSDCLADIFTDFHKYKEFFPEISSDFIVDYATEYQKYLKEKEKEEKMNEACGNPDLWIHYNLNNRIFPRKVTKEEVLLCVNLHTDADPEQGFDVTFQGLQRENVLKGIEESQK